MPSLDVVVYIGHFTRNNVTYRGLMAASRRKIALTIGEHERFVSKAWKATDHKGYVDKAMSAQGKLLYAGWDTHSPDAFSVAPEANGHTARQNSA